WQTIEAETAPTHSSTSSKRKSPGSATFCPKVNKRINSASSKPAVLPKLFCAPSMGCSRHGRLTPRLTCPIKHLSYWTSSTTPSERSHHERHRQGTPQRPVAASQTPSGTSSHHLVEYTSGTVDCAPAGGFDRGLYSVGQRSRVAGHSHCRRSNTLGGWRRRRAAVAL